jgi:hypothetical protein
VPQHTDGELRILFAELLREWFEDSGERENAARVRKVTGYRDATQVRYQGMSCEYEVAIVDIFWEDHEGESHAFEWRGDFAGLIGYLGDLAERY